MFTQPGLRFQPGIKRYITSSTEVDNARHVICRILIKIQKCKIKNSFVRDSNPPHVDTRQILTRLSCNPTLSCESVLVHWPSENLLVESDNRHFCPYKSNFLVYRQMSEYISTSWCTGRCQNILQVLGVQNTGTSSNRLESRQY